MYAKEEFLELHKALEFLIIKEHPDFSLFREPLETIERLSTFSYDQTLRTLHLSKKYSDQLFFLIKQKIPSFLCLSDQTYIRITHDFCTAPEEFYTTVMLHCMHKYKYHALDKEIDGRICVAKADLCSCLPSLDTYSEEEIRKILESSLEEEELSPCLRYFCYLATHKKNTDFQFVSRKTQYEVVDIIDPKRKYQEFGLRIDPQKEINEPFMVMRVFFKNYKPIKGRPSSDAI